MEKLFRASDIKREALAAEKRIKQYIRETPVEYSPYFSKLGNCQVYLKLENLQITRSFKLRGALNKLLSLDRKQLEKGVVAASSGNHGAALAYGLKIFGAKGTIYLPHYTSPTKIECLRNYDIDLIFHGDDCLQTEKLAIEEAKNKNLTYIPPYNDPQIIGGQATVGIELERQLSNIDAVFIPVGGGGLISGIAGYLKSSSNKIRIIGCQPINSCVMYESVKAGRVVEQEIKPTISEGTAGGIEEDSLTFYICRRYVDDFILVSEEEIKEAMKLIISKHSFLVEGAAALSLASWLKAKDQFTNKNVVLIISGAKISFDRLQEIICRRK
ncbi:MAG: threonine/serine dehydratase [Candidatus Aminicenantales bacterium]